jgi:MFS family permease
MASGSYRQVLGRKGFQSFLWTQFLGAFNDNLFKIVVSMLAVQMAAGSAAGRNLSLVGAIFILPFLLFSGYAGQLADIFSKRTVLVVTKSLEVLTALLALAAFVVGRLEITFVVLFLFALQATFFSPAKYGILPEVLPDRDLSRANGLLEMSTFVAIVAGTAIGSYLLEIWRAELWLVGVMVVAIAVVGTTTSFGIPRVGPAAPGARMRLNPMGEIVDGMKRLLGDRVLFLTVIGISYFWFLGALLQLVTVLFGTEILKLDGRWIGLLTAFAAIGIGIGSVVAGRLSGDKVELGLAPLGSIGTGRLRDRSLTVHDAGNGGDQLDPDRLFRRAVRRAAQRVAAAEERRSGKGPADGDQQLREHGRRHDRVGGVVAVQLVPVDVRRSNLLHLRGLDAHREHLRAERRAGIYHPLQPVAAHAHRLPDPDRGAGERTLARACAARVQPPVAR